MEEKNRHDEEKESWKEGEKDERRTEERKREGMEEEDRTRRRKKIDIRCFAGVSSPRRGGCGDQRRLFLIHLNYSLASI